MFDSVCLGLRLSGRQSKQNDHANSFAYNILFCLIRVTFKF